MPSRATNPHEKQRRKRSRSPSQLLKTGTKSIRGLLKGKSKKKKKLKLKDVQIPSEIDESTVYNVEIDPNVPTPTHLLSNEKKLISVVEEARKKLKETPIQIVLLLMDASSRRFELIQLSFDASSATVHDILKQIPVSATEDSLQRQAYDSVCLTDGSLMSDDVYLIAFIDQLKKSDNILLAIPTGMEPSECMKLSAPILNDPKVKNMLKGADSTEAKPPPVEDEVSDVSEPFEQVVEEVEEEEEGEDIEEKAAELEPVFKLDTMEVTSKEIDEVESTEKDHGTLLLFFVLLWIFVPILMAVQARITSPLSPGDTLLAGQYRSTCGILSILPEELVACDDTVLTMTDTGLLTLSAFEGETESVLWEMEGNCPDGEECVAKFQEDGYITIGDSQGKFAKGKKFSIALTPFPFTVEPITSKRKK